MFTAREMAQLRRLELMAAKMKRGVLQGEREVSRSGPGTSFREHRAGVDQAGEALLLDEATHGNDVRRSVSRIVETKAIER